MNFNKIKDIKKRKIFERIDKIIRTHKHLYRRNKKGIFTKIYSKNSKCINHPNKPSKCQNLCWSCYRKHIKSFKSNLENEIKKVAFGKLKQFKKEYIKYVNKRRKDGRKNSILKSKYGITLNDYKKLFKQQKGKCLVCGKKSNKTLHVDHNHKTGKVRGLLCFRCNYGIGYFHENIYIFKNIIKLLEG